MAKEVRLFTPRGRLAWPFLFVPRTEDRDGKPLAEGEILFLAVNGQAVDSLPIANGSFSGSVSVGPQRVQLAVYTTVKRSLLPAEPPVEAQENMLPAKYHTGSTLTAEIKPDTNPPLSFDLKSEPKKPARK